MYARSWRTSRPPGRPVSVRLSCTPLSNPARQCRGPGHHHDCPRPALTEQTTRNALHAFHQRGLSALQLPIVPPPYYRDHLRRGHLRGFCRTVAFSSVGESVTPCIPDTRFLDFAPKIKLCDRTYDLPNSDYPVSTTQEGNVTTLLTDDQGITPQDLPTTTTHCTGERAQEESGTDRRHSTLL